MNRKLNCFKYAALGALLWQSVSVCFAQDKVADFYRGKTITIVTGSPDGGDIYARLIARYLGKHIPGSPNVILTSMQGAGGTLAARYVASVAPADGTYIANPTATAQLAPILQDASSVMFDPTHVNYLGSAGRDAYVCIVRTDAPATTYSEMFKKQVTLGGASASGFTGYYPIIQNNLLGTKFKVVLGYAGVSAIMLAVQRNEVQGQCGMHLTLLKAQFSNLLADGTIKIVVQESVQGTPELNSAGIPLTASFAQTEEKRRILGILYSQEVFAFPYLVAENVPVDRLDALRHAFLEIWRDPDLLKDAATLKLDIDPVSGEDVQALIKRIYSSPPSLLQSAKVATKQK
jgi:tripartite-type tricarboxylate transporter receptor subunit TctC